MDITISLAEINPLYFNSNKLRTLIYVKNIWQHMQSKLNHVQSGNTEYFCRNQNDAVDRKRKQSSNRTRQTSRPPRPSFKVRFSPLKNEGKQEDSGGDSTLHSSQKLVFSAAIQLSHTLLLHATPPLLQPSLTILAKTLFFAKFLNFN